MAPVALGSDMSAMTKRTRGCERRALVTRLS